MATKKSWKPLGPKGCKKCKILDGYQMATKGTFSDEKVPFFRVLARFLQDFFKCEGRCTGLMPGKSHQNLEKRAKSPTKWPKKSKLVGTGKANAGALSAPSGADFQVQNLKGGIPK